MYRIFSNPLLKINWKKPHVFSSWTRSNNIEKHVVIQYIFGIICLWWFKKKHFCRKWAIWKHFTRQYDFVNIITYFMKQREMIGLCMWVHWFIFEYFMLCRLSVYADTGFKHSILQNGVVYKDTSTYIKKLWHVRKKTNNIKN